MEQNSESIGIKVKCLVQQCLSAKLFTKLEDQINKIEPEYVEVRIFDLEAQILFIEICLDLSRLVEVLFCLFVL